MIYATTLLDRDNRIESTYNPTTLLKLGKPKTLFDQFENLSFCEYWYDSNDTLKSIILPRFALSFSYDQSKNRLLSKEYPGFFLEKNQSTPYFRKDFILLVNDQGEKKLLLPDQNLNAPSKKEVLLPAFEREKELYNDVKTRFHHFPYEINSKGDFIASSREGYFHLIEALAADQKYGEAAYYLKRYGTKLSAYTPDEAKRLKKIARVSSITGDNSGEQLSIALYAANMLKNNPVKIDIDSLLLTIYPKYLDHYQQITTLRLPADQERRLVKNLIQIKFSNAFFYRLRELDPSYAKRFDPTKGVIFSESIRFHPPNIYQLTFIDVAFNLEDSLVTRANVLVRDALVNLAQKAVIGTYEEKRWIESACHFLSAHEQENIRSCGWLLKNILENPNRYEGLKSSRLEDCKSFLEEIVGNLDHDDTIDLFTLPSVDITPDHYRLDRIPAEEPTIPFSFSFEDVDYFSSLVETSASSVKPVDQALQNFFEEQKATLDKEQDPQQYREWSRLGEDLNSFNSEPPKPQFKLKNSLDEIRNVLEQPNKEFSQLKEELIELANRKPENELEAKRHQLQLWGGILHPVTIDDIIMSFARKEPRILQSINPILSETDLTTLYTKTAKYLNLSVREKQKERCLKTLNQIPKTGNQELEALLANQLSSTRAYNPINHPAYLAFEHYAEIILYQTQVDMLDAFLKGGNPSPVMELIMGSGKSKVLIPLLGLMRADGKNLSMVIVPSSLFESISSDTQTILRDAFGKSLQTLNFDRNSTFTERSLEEIRDILKEVIKNKECLIMTSKSIQCLLLKFIEHVHENKNLGAEFLLMQEIIRLFAKAGNPLIDEADSVLNLLHRVSFSIGKALQPPKEERELVGLIFSTLYSDPEIKAIAKLECDPAANEKAPPITEKLYHERLKEPLARAVLANIRKGEVLPKLTSYLNNNRDDTRLLKYLCRNQDSQAYYQGLPENIKGVVALLGEELSHLLPHTLTREYNKNYGVVNGIAHAIPFSAVDTPNIGSIFAKPLITMNYTLQAYLKRGIDQTLVLNEVQRLQKYAQEEVYETGESLEVTNAYKKFKSLCGDLVLPFYKLNDQHLESLTKQINSSLQEKTNFITRLILPTIELYEKELTCDPIGLVSLFTTVCGFTGTLWNAQSMDRKIVPIPSKGTDAKTLTLLWGMTKNGVHVISKGSTQSMLEKINIDFDLVSDVGGYFKQGGSLTTARTMALRYKKPCLYYDSNGAQRLTDGKNEFTLKARNLTPDQRITFLDQSHTTGADVKQKKDAIAIVTIGKKYSSETFYKGFGAYENSTKNRR